MGKNSQNPNFSYRDKFYKTAKWTKKRNEIRKRDDMKCQYPTHEGNRLILGRCIVDHIIELTDENWVNDKIAYGDDNLQLLCIECHNKKTADEARKKKDVYGQIDMKLKPNDLKTAVPIKIKK